MLRKSRKSFGCEIWMKEEIYYRDFLLEWKMNEEKCVKFKDWITNGNEKLQDKQTWISFYSDLIQ